MYLVEKGKKGEKERLLKQNKTKMFFCTELYINENLGFSYRYKREEFASRFPMIQHIMFAVLTKH